MDKIEKLITDSLIEFLQLSCITELKTEMNTKLVFPIKRDGKRRISEQEIRFLFVQHVQKDNFFHYSVEVPTKKRYKFLGLNDRSASFDVCLYENGNRKHLLEFKALNPKQNSYSKDFEKLFFDESDLTNYFIQVIETTNIGTIPNIEKKYREAIKHVKNKYNIIRPCLKIFLCDMDKKNIIEYKIDKDGNLIKIQNIIPLLARASRS